MSIKTAGFYCNALFYILNKTFDIAASANSSCYQLSEV